MRDDAAIVRLEKFRLVGLKVWRRVVASNRRGRSIHLWFEVGQSGRKPPWRAVLKRRRRVLRTAAGRALGVILPIEACLLVLLVFGDDHGVSESAVGSGQLAGRVAPSVSVCCGKGLRRSDSAGSDLAHAA